MFEIILNTYLQLSLCKKCPYSELFWSAFSRIQTDVQIHSLLWSLFSHIQTEYGDLRSKSPYSVRIPENTDHKNVRIWTLFTKWGFKAGFALSPKNTILEMHPSPSNEKLLFEPPPPALLGLKMILITSHKIVPFWHGTEFVVATPLQKELAENQVLRFLLHWAWFKMETPEIFPTPKNTWLSIGNKFCTPICRTLNLKLHFFNRFYYKVSNHQSLFDFRVYTNMKQWNRVSKNYLNVCLLSLWS